MRRALIVLAIAASVAVCLASLPIPPALQAPIADLAARRAAGAGAFKASRAALGDGRVLLTGGRKAGRTTAEAMMLAVDGTASPASPMRHARSGHCSVLLADGRVLVTGGLTPAGATASAEIYDPASGRWMDAGWMTEARVAHTATLLEDGQVLIAGGSSLEIYDPTQGSFAFAGALSPPRSAHAAALLSDGRVLLTGGSAEGAPLGFADLYDPSTGRMTPTGRLGTPRSGHSATTLGDGRVVLAGGRDEQGELRSVEVYDPASGKFSDAGRELKTGRTWHDATLLAGSDRILVEGGFAADKLVAPTEILDLGNAGVAAGTLDEAGGALSETRLPAAPEAATLETTSPDLASVSADLDQCRNDTVASPVPCSGAAWVNGNAGSSNSHWLEADSIPYRMKFANLTPGTTHHVTIEWDTTKGGKHAIDYVTTFNRTAVDANPCTDVSGCTYTPPPPADANGLGSGSFSVKPIPADPNVTGAGVTPVPSVFTLFGGSIGVISGYSVSGSYAGDSSTRITINFTASSASPVLAWGGHIAARLDWGASNSAVAISGSPFHTRLIEFDDSGGNQDRGLSSDAVIFPGSITIIKDVANDTDPMDFSFTTSKLPVASFQLDDDGTSNNPLSDTRVFSQIIDFNSTRTITEAGAMPVFALTALNCTLVSQQSPPGTATGNVGTRTATIDLKEGESATCTFVNTRQNGTLRVIKRVVNDNGGTRVPADFSLHVKSGGTDVTGSPQAGSAPGTVYSLPQGTYSVSEDDPASLGYARTGFSGDCDSGGVVAVQAGVERTCTVTNDDIAPKLIVIKHVVNDDGGTAAASSFQMSVTGSSPLPASFPGAESPGTMVSLKQGQYSVDESGPTGYAKSLSPECTGTINVGETKTCTVTNDDIAPKLIVIKHVVNDGGGTATASSFQMSVTGVSPAPASFPGAESPGTPVILKQGQYSVDESGPSGYAKSLSSECTGTINVGETKTCTVTNDDIAPKLIVIKHVVNDDGGTAAAGAFTLQVSVTGGRQHGIDDPDAAPSTLLGVPPSGPSPGTFPGAEAPGTDVTLYPGNYTVRESGPSGYAPSYSEGCTGSIVLGQTKTCTVTNDDVAPRLIVIKHVVNDSGGTATAASFTMSVAGTSPAPASFPGSEAPGTAVKLRPGSYSVSEDGPGSYAPSSSEGCSGSIAIGETRVCTITNDDIAPKLIVIKHVVNDNGGTATASSFTMTVTAAGAAPALFPGAESPGTNVSLLAGTYSVSEIGPDGYAASLSPQCAGSIAIGETKICTVTNDDIAPKLIVIKHVVNNDGGTASASSFLMNVTGGSPSPASFPGAEAPGTTVTLSQGAYSVGENGLPGYLPSFSNQCSGAIKIGETKTCTVTNDDVRPKLIVIKHVVNDDGGTATSPLFQMSVTGTIPSPASFPGAESPGTTVNLRPGSYSVSESGPSGYAKSLSADCTGSIAIGETKVCTVTNDDVRPRLIVIKHVVNDDGGTAAAPLFQMSVTGTSPSPASFPGAESSGTTVSLLPGTYSVSESSLSGYAKSLSADCTGSIAIGETKTCTVTNDDIRPMLIVIKHVVNDDGGTATAPLFQMSVTGTSPSPASFPGAESPGTTVSLLPGTYSVSESSLSGYAKSLSADCTGSIAIGETKTCTVTNDDIRPKLIVIKHVVNDDGGTATAPLFQMSVTGTSPSPASFPGAESPGTTVSLLPGTYSVSEDSLPGYAKSLSADCTGSIAIGETKTCTVTNDDIRPKLIVIKHVVNDDGGTATAPLFQMSVTGTSPSPASFPGAESPGTTVSLLPGTYSVSESSLSGYAKSLSADCTGSIAIGETKTCTVTNDDVRPKLIVIKHVVNDDGGTATAPLFQMSVTGTSPSPASFPGAESPGTTVFLTAGGYSVTETGPSGYAPNLSSGCAGSIAVGETKTCTVTNDDVRPKLIVIKHVVNDGGGTASASSFTMTVTGSSPSPSSFPGAESPGTMVMLRAGSYSVNESGPSNYAPSLSSDCSGSIGVGETRICTVTNNDIAQCVLGYPYSSSNPRTGVTFNESEVLRVFAPSIARPHETIKVWYNDEHALTLGVRQIVVKTSSGTTTTDFPITPLSGNPGTATDPLVGTTVLSGDNAGTDVSDRPMYPALFITDVTNDPSSKAGDWQMGGTGILPHAVFGTWKGAVRTVDKTKVPTLVTVTPDTDPSTNNWSLGQGSDTPPGGFGGYTNEGYGAEVRWDVDRLNLIPGHTYRMQFMVHDGDQNKVGGDSGQNCLTVAWPQ